MRRLAVARVIQRDRYRADIAARVIGEMLAEPKYRDRAAVTGAQVRGEDGLRDAANALELLVRTAKPAAQSAR